MTLAGDVTMHRMIGPATLFVVAVACAHQAPVPGELVQARTAYAQASSGAAAEGASARLRTAKQALDEAETAYARNADGQAVRVQSYVALRKIQTAEAEGAAALAAERRRHALEELATLPGRYADQARSQIAVDRGGPAPPPAHPAAGPPPVVDSTALTAGEARAAAEARSTQALDTLSRETPVRQEQRGLVITLPGQILFADGDATLLPTATAGLNDVAAALAAMSGTPGRILIEGHTDARDPQGRTLAERRATAVRDYLVARGVSRSLFVVQSVGGDDPVAPSDTAEGRAANRRVEIVVPQQPSSRPGSEPAIPGPPAPASPTTTTTPTFPLPRPTPPARPEMPTTPPPGPDLGPAPIPSPNLGPAPIPGVPRP
jgi:flagellar motor protein MotB